jgi:predicted alpha/beta hydrolase family esterase
MGKKSKTPLALEIIQWLFPKVEWVSQALAARWFWYLFFTPFRYQPPEKEVEVARQAEKYLIEVDGKDVQIYAWGQGPAVLMVHGWAGRGTQFRKFIEPFNEAGLRVVAIDGPAHGRSEGRRTEIMGFAKAIRQVFEKEKAVAIIAHSFGGVASLYAIAHGLHNRVQINIASPSIGDEIIKTFLRALNASASIGERFKKYVIKKTGKHFDDFSALEIVKHIPKDTHLLLVHDEDDLEVTIEHPRALQNRFPQAILFETKKLGHNRILKEDTVINRCVTFVLQKASLSADKI